MRNAPAKLSIYPFGLSDPLHTLQESTQRNYLCQYLGDMGASSVLEEKNYFDRDYLAEFSAFYGISSAGYPNICRRLHIFSGKPLTRGVLRSAISGVSRAKTLMQKNYLGFVVVRPIPSAPFGRTVLAWYPDSSPGTPRVDDPSREYKVHVAGMQLKIRGLAWQQQDTGVGACATVGLWSMLHSSAFDDQHSIPTTAEITRAAHRTASMGSRVFPSAGLTVEQICEAIKEHSLSPIVFRGDMISGAGDAVGFSKERFASSCAALIRSKYPVLIIGQFIGDGHHAMCAVGFRSCSPSLLAPREVGLQDSGVEYLYIHDDNLGPNVRFRVKDNGPKTSVSIIPEAPPLKSKATVSCSTSHYPEFIPYLLVVAAHNDLRTSPDTLHKTGIKNAYYIVSVLNDLMDAKKFNGLGLSFSARYVKLADYLTVELQNTLGGKKRLLSKVRLALSEEVPPMSLHLGLIRIGLDDSTPLLDVLYDTTDSDRNHPAFASVCYNQIMPIIIKNIEATGVGKYGVAVHAF